MSAAGMLERPGRATRPLVRVAERRPRRTGRRMTRPDGGRGLRGSCDATSKIPSRPPSEKPQGRTDRPRRAASAACNRTGRQRRSGSVRCLATPESDYAAWLTCAEGERNLTRGASPGLPRDRVSGDEHTGEAGDAGKVREGRSNTNPLLKQQVNASARR
jgi:hypothetical protein